MKGKKHTTDIFSIGIIMDGNRRFARARGISRAEGHAAGYAKLKEFLRWARDVGATHVIAYAFSTENWKRERSEVRTLMSIFAKVLRTEAASLVRDRIRVRFIGALERFSRPLRTLMNRVEWMTSHGDGPVLALAVSYGGRSELANAAHALISTRAAVRGKISNVSEEEFASHLKTHDLPDPDLIIRTGGARRLSNFLPWQSVYSELAFSDTLWPEFTEREFKGIIADFRARERRFGA